MPDIEMKRHDTFPPLKVTLEQINQETGKAGPIDLTTATSVKFLMKKLGAGGKPEGSTIEILSLTGWGGSTVKNVKGQVEVAWTKAATENLEEFAFEFEIEFPESGGVKRYQSVPSEGYRTIKFIEDLETL